MNQEKILVEVNRYHTNGKDTVISEFYAEDIDSIKTCLIKLNEALTKNDRSEITQYEKILNEKGIFGEKY
jgi:hypothetical protein